MGKAAAGWDPRWAGGLQVLVGGWCWARAGREPCRTVPGQPLGACGLLSPCSKQELPLAATETALGPVPAPAEAAPSPPRSGDVPLTPSNLGDAQSMSPGHPGLSSTSIPPQAMCSPLHALPVSCPVPKVTFETRRCWSRLWLSWEMGQQMGTTYPAVLLWTLLTPKFGFLLFNPPPQQTFTPILLER